ncbi:MAG: hypothetical protein BWK79_01760 [Beggiatoa sp. IS2]|nr:MAG: hypothetical protein BWK79_01760 [Beggiatoa sp. IS2]
MQIYQPLNQSLQNAHALMKISEVHGLLCGLLCTSQNISEKQWLDHLFDENDGENLLIQNCQKQLFLLKEYTASQLSSDEYPFNLLLPEDDSSLIERTQALAEWCQGFLLGLGLTLINQLKLTAELEEFIKDMISISHLAPPEQESEEDETAYAELIEYIRVGILMLYQELMTMESSLHE